jgi:outer membrane lipoprotein SlyB
MKTTTTLAASVLVATSFLAGCASESQPMNNSQGYPSQNTYPAASQQQGYSTQYGVVDSIQVTRAPAHSGPGVGAVLGGVVGGLLGNQVGGGNGKVAATAAGAIGGAVVGNQVEQNNRTAGAEMYQINVRLDNGSYVTVTQDTMNDLRVGNRVRVDNGRVYRY